MALRKDKQKVIGEDMTDAQVAVYINYQPITTSADAVDYLILQNSYRGLRAHDFERFMKGFVAQGRDKQAKDRYGKTLTDYMKEHRNSGEYIAILESA